MPKPTKFGRWRSKQGLTLQEVADLTGYSVAYISQIENAHRSPSVEAKIKMARRLDTPIAELFEVDSVDLPA